MTPQFLKERRVKIHALILALNMLDKSRFTALAITNAERLKMKLGKLLGHLNEPNPYPESYNPANTTVEPTADVSSPYVVKATDPIAILKEFRLRFKELYDDLKIHFGNMTFNDVNSMLIVHSAFDILLAIDEVTNWLGMEMAAKAAVNENTNKLGNKPSEEEGNLKNLSDTGKAGPGPEKNNTGAGDETGKAGPEKNAGVGEDAVKVDPGLSKNTSDDAATNAKESDTKNGAGEGNGSGNTVDPNLKQE